VSGCRRLQCRSEDRTAKPFDKDIVTAKFQEVGLVEASLQETI